MGVYHYIYMLLSAKDNKIMGENEVLEECILIPRSLSILDAGESNRY